MLAKFGWSVVCVVGGIFAEFVVYEFWPTFISLWGVGMSEISNTPAHHMIRAFCQWLPLPIMIIFVPLITIGTIVWLWRQP